MVVLPARDPFHQTVALNTVHISPNVSKHNMSICIPLAIKLIKILCFNAYFILCFLFLQNDLYMMSRPAVGYSPTQPACCLSLSF